MVKAHSLLYAIYICLIVSIICGALLYFANLYSQLNLHYNLQEEMYIHNQSVVNFALGSKIETEEFPIDENSGIEGTYDSKQYGLLTLLLAKSILRNDTIASAHIVGSYSSDKKAIYLANFTQSMSYSGEVKLIGDNYLPSTYIKTTYLKTNQITLLLREKQAFQKLIYPKLIPISRKFSKT